MDDNETNTIAKIKQYQNNAKLLKEKEKTLAAINAKCDNLGEHNDVRSLTESLSEQLTITIEVIRNQLQLITRQITVLEVHLNRLRAQAMTPALSENTIGSSPMPEHVVSVEIDTSESLPTPKYPEGVAHIEQQTSFIVDTVPAVDTVDTSVQTRENKRTENILVSQTVSDGGRETIKFESTPNPIISEQVEDVFVDAKYQQPNDPNRTTELVLRNVPQTSFETTFVEPDDTTTEVVVDAEGRKTIIIRKVMRTVQQHRVIEHRQQLTEVSSIVGADNKPIEQTVSQINTQNQSVSNTVSDGSGSKSISVHQSQASYATGDAPDNLVIQEVIEGEPVIHVSETSQPIEHHQGIEIKALEGMVMQEPQSDVQHSSIQTVVHQVTKRVIRRKKRIIRRVTIIDGKEHVTEEVIEEPDEIEESESEIPNVNVNIVRNTIITKDGESSKPIIELAADEPIQKEYEPQPVDIVAQTQVIEKQPKTTEGKKERTKSRKLKEQNDQEDIQVFEIKPAPVDLAIENAQVEPALLDTTIDVVNNVQLPAQTVEIETQPTSQSQVIEESIEISKEPEITDINKIWPPDEPSDHSQPMSHTTSKSIEIKETSNIQPSKDDSIPSQQIWPLDEKTGHTIVLETYTFEKETKSPENVLPEPVQPVVSTVDIDIKSESIERTTPIVIEESNVSPKSSIQIEEVIEAAPVEIVQEPTKVETSTVIISEQIQPSEPIVEESSSKTYSIHDDNPDIDNKKDKKKKKKSKKKKTDSDSKEQSIPSPKIEKEEEKVIKAADQRSDVEKSAGTPVSIEIKTTKTTEVFNIVSPEKLTEPQIEMRVEPVILIDEIKSEENVLKELPKEEIVLQKPTIDVRTATQLFIDNELNVSDATTRTVKVSLTPKESTSPGSLMVKMKLEPNDKPNLNVNIVEESVITQKDVTPPKVESEIDPSVVESVELDIGDDNTISEKMEMPEIEATPVPMDDKVSIQIEQKTAISPDESYRSMSELQTPVKIIEESVLSSGSDSPKPIGAELVIATDILEEQQIEDAEQQTSPIQITDIKEAVISEKPTLDSRSIQTSPDVKQSIDVTQQTSPVQQADGGIQTEISVHEIHVQTSPIPIGDVEMSREPIQTTSEEVQTDVIPEIPTSEKSMQVEVSVKDVETSPRSEIRIEQETINVTDVVPQVTDKLVSDIIQTIPIQIPTKDEHTTTEIIQTTEVDTQTSIENVSAQPSKTEPYEIHIQTSIIVPEEADTMQGDEPIVVEVNKSFIIEEGDPTTVREVDRPQKSKPKKKKKSKSKSATEQFIEIESQKLPSDPTPVQSTSVEAVTPQESILIESDPIENPTQVTLNITKTTVFDTTNVVGVEQRIIEEERQLEQKKPHGSISSVTIEEVLSPTEEKVNVPVTPDIDSIDGVVSPQTNWAEHLIAANEQNKNIIESIPSTSLAISIKPPEDQEWEQANHVITDRIKNIQNAQRAHLSNVLHLTSLAQTVTPDAIKQRASIIEENLDQLKDATTTKNTVLVHETVIKIIEEISTWLETIEYRVYLNRQNSSDGPSDDKIVEFQNLRGELDGIATTVQDLNKCLQKTNKMVNPAEQQRMIECLDNLKKQVTAVDTVTKETNDEVRSNMKRWTEYITIVETITTTITQLQLKLDTIQNEDTPLSTRLQQLDDLERRNGEQIDDINRSMQIARGLVRDFPSKQFPVDIHASYESARNFENAIALERNRLLQLQSLAEDYEETLNQFAQIIILAETVVEQPIEAKNLDELQQEMQKHRKFFVNLNHCRSILESLKENIDSESRNKHNDLHNSLHEKASQILEKASERSQRISMAASRWTVLEKNLRDEKQWLQMAQQRVPDLSEVSTVDYERYITMYKSICSDVDQHNARLIHLTNIAIQLQELVKSPTIQEESNDCFAALLKLKDELKIYLSRLITFREIWTTYETQTDRLEQWILQSERELAQIEIPKDLRIQPIENTRRFWEIRVHYEVNNNLRKEIGDTLERSIEILPFRDELMQRQFHRQLEDRWANVSRKIDFIQNAIINGLSAQDMPINEKLELLRRELDELQIAVTSTKSVIKNEEELNIYIERMQLLNSRLSVIYNELGRLSLLPTHDPEQIGELFALSQSISSPVAEEIENSLILKNSLRSIQNGIKRMRQTQENNLTVLNACESSEKLGSDQIELAVIDCQHLATELEIQWQEIMHLRQLLHTLPMRLRVSVSPVKLERDLSQLQDNHADHEARCTQILNMLKNRLSLWKRFERQLEIVQQTNNETEFMIDLLKVNGQVDYERLKKTTERLEVRFHTNCFFFSLFNSNRQERMLNKVY